MKLPTSVKEGNVLDAEGAIVCLCPQNREAYADLISDLLNSAGEEGDRLGENGDVLVILDPPVVVTEYKV